MYFTDLFKSLFIIYLESLNKNVARRMCTMYKSKLLLVVNHSHLTNEQLTDQT